MNTIKKKTLSAVRVMADRIHRILRGASRRVLVDGGSFMHFDQFRTLVPALLADDRITLRITTSWGLRSPELRDALMDSLGLDRSRMTVLFAPTYGEGGLLHDQGVAFLERLVGPGTVNVVVKLHPCSLRTDDTRFASGVDWASLLESRFASYDGFRHVVDWDVLELMCIADVMISDFGSSAVDYAVTGKPLVFYASRRQHENLCGCDEQWRALKDASWRLIDEKTDLDVVIGDICASCRVGGEQASSSVVRLREMFHPHLGTATYRTLNVLYKAMQLEPPVDLQQLAQPPVDVIFRFARNSK